MAKSKTTNKKLPIGIDKPIAFFDLETTGLDIATTRIVSLTVIKLFPNGKREAKSTLVDPEIPIPAEATEIHGITNDAVKGKPKFKQIANSLRDFIGDSIIAGFNSNKFDVPVLAEEFLRAGLLFPKHDNILLDAGNIFKKKERRTLEAALMFYCGEELGDDAHDSYNDTVATLNVFIGQLEKYPDLAEMSIEEIAEFSKMDDRIDFAGRIALDDDGDYVFNFGKHKGTKVKDEESYARWMLANDFTHNTKYFVKKALGMIDDGTTNGELNFDGQ
jgi:DNA polymerase-3 subunit epsilon